MSDRSARNPFDSRARLCRCRARSETNGFLVREHSKEIAIATFDSRAGIYEITVGIVGTGGAATDFLSHIASKNLDREMIEAMPVVTIRPRQRVRDLDLRIHLSALDQDVLRADVVVAILTDDPETDPLLADLGFVSKGSAPQPQSLLSGAGRSEGPILAAFVDATCTRPQMERVGMLVRQGDLARAESVGVFLQEILRAVLVRHIGNDQLAVPLPSEVHQGFHDGEGAASLAAEGMPRPGSDVRLNIKPHEPLEESNGSFRWKVALAGKVTDVVGLHEVDALVEGRDPAFPALSGKWRARLKREEGFRCPWMLRSLERA